MHPNPAFRGISDAQSLDFARSRGFGILALNGSDRPLHAHIPFLIAADGKSVDLHLTRANAIARAVTSSAPVLLTVSGPDTYISPDWYGVPQIVPTWNYVAVNLLGRLERLPDAAMLDMLVRQSHDFEARLAPKPEWRLDKLTAETLAKLIRMIVPFRLHVEDVQSTWKLGQNRTPEARLAAADGVAEAGFGSDTDDIAHLMRNV